MKYWYSQLCFPLIDSSPQISGGSSCGRQCQGPASSQIENANWICCKVFREGRNRFSNPISQHNSSKSSTLICVSCGQYLKKSWVPCSGPSSIRIFSRDSFLSPLKLACLQNGKQHEVAWKSVRSHISSSFPSVRVLFVTIRHPGHPSKHGSTPALII